MPTQSIPTPWARASHPPTPSTGILEREMEWGTREGKDISKSIKSILILFSFCLVFGLCVNMALQLYFLSFLLVEVPLLKEILKGSCNMQIYNKGWLRPPLCCPSHHSPISGFLASQDSIGRTKLHQTGPLLMLGGRRRGHSNYVHKWSH